MLTFSFPRENRLRLGFGKIFLPPGLFMTIDVSMKTLPSTLSFNVDGGTPQLVAAYLYVKEKRVAVKFAARAFGVPPSTLNDRVQGKVFIDTSIVMNNPGGRKILPKPNLNRFSRVKVIKLLGQFHVDIF
jgi:hypothetical protein